MDRIDRQSGNYDDKTDGDELADRILDAAGAEFIEKGFAAATTLAIARRARVSKRDLYRLFGSKQGLAEALISKYTARMASPSLASAKSRADFYKILEAFGAMLLAELFDARRIAFYRLAIGEAPKSTQLARALRDKGQIPVEQSVRRFVGEAVARGVVPMERIELAMGCFFAVLMGDRRLNVLMGLEPAPTPEEIGERSARAARVLKALLEAPSDNLF